MSRCVFMTLADRGNFSIDDDRAIAPLAARGIEVQSVPWDDPQYDWAAADLVVIRSPWDYFRRLDEFLATLTRIEATGVPIFNSPDVVRWNCRKTYLRELAERGIPIVPTLWFDCLQPGQLAQLYASLASAEIVVKPVVSGAAMGTWRLDAAGVVGQAEEIEAFFATRALMAQPLVTSVLEEGEYSLFYFNGVFSHCARKRPKSADFRVQEEHGGLILDVPAPAGSRELSRAILNLLDGTLLYARVDLVRHPAGGFWLMELELIEPSLYLRINPQAPERFAAAIAERLVASRRAD